MAKATHPLGSGRDHRPRIHIRRHPANGTVSWSFGPCGPLHHAPTPGAAFEAIVDDIRDEQAVIFWEGSFHA